MCWRKYVPVWINDNLQDLLILFMALDFNSEIRIKLCWYLNVI